MPKPHFYDNLDKSEKLTMELDLRQVAEQIEGMNYGTHRFLSHLIDIRRQSRLDRIKMYRDRGDDDIAAEVARRGDPISDAIEKLLLDDEF